MRKQKLKADPFLGMSTVGTMRLTSIDGYEVGGSTMAGSNYSIASTPAPVDFIGALMWLGLAVFLLAAMRPVFVVVFGGESAQRERFDHRRADVQSEALAVLRSWRCDYCDGLNTNQDLECTKCGGPRNG